MKLWGDGSEGWRSLGAVLLVGFLGLNPTTRSSDQRDKPGENDHRSLADGGKHGEALESR